MFAPPPLYPQPYYHTDPSMGLTGVVITLWFIIGFFYASYSMCKYEYITLRQFGCRMVWWPGAALWDFLLHMKARRVIIKKLKQVLPERRHDELWLKSLSELRDIEYGLFKKTDLRVGIHRYKWVKTSYGSHRSQYSQPRNEAANTVEVPQELLLGRICPSTSKLKNGRLWVDAKDNTAQSITFTD